MNYKHIIKWSNQTKETKRKRGIIAKYDFITSSSIFFIFQNINGFSLSVSLHSPSLHSSSSKKFKFTNIIKHVSSSLHYYNYMRSFTLPHQPQLVKRTNRFILLHQHVSTHSDIPRRRNGLPDQSSVHLR